MKFRHLNTFLHLRLLFHEFHCTRRGSGEGIGGGNGRGNGDKVEVEIKEEMDDEVENKWKRI